MLSMLSNRIIIASFCKIFKKKPGLNANKNQDTAARYISTNQPHNIFLINQLNKIIQKCNPKNKKLMTRILEIKQNDPEEKKVNELVVSMIDYNKKKIFSTYEWAVATILLRNCQNIAIRSLKIRAMNMFLFYSDAQGTFLNKQSETSSTFQQIYQIQFSQLQQKDIQFIFLEISRQFIDIVNKESQKNKKNKIRMKLLTMINQFQPKIHSISAMKQMLHLLTQLQDNRSIITKFRVSKSIGLLAQKMIQKVNEDPSMSENMQKNSNKHDKFNAFNYLTILKSLSYSQNQSKENFRFFVDMIASPNFFQQNSDNEFRFNIYRKAFKSSRDYFDQNGKNPILERFKYLFLNDQQFRNHYCNQREYILHYFFGDILISKFYQHYKKIPSKQIEGCIMILQLPPFPQLDQCQKKMLHLAKTKILSIDKKLTVVLQKFYPQMLSQQQRVQDYSTNKNNSVVYLDNELGGRLGLVFDSLGLKYEKQVKIGGRSCDFLIEGKIILECDGDYHIDYKNYDVNDNTADRNILFLYSGYRLITIDLQQFNNTRGLSSLKELVTKKLGLLKKHNALQVS